MKISDAQSDIRNLQSVYNTAGDRGRIEDVIAVFTEEGTLEIPGALLKGRDAISAFLSGVASSASNGIDLRGSRHHLSTSRIDVHDEHTALGWTYFYVTRAGQIIQEGTYVDQYVSTLEGWRIAHRRVKILWTFGDGRS
ncbi:MAG: nuclear transport factor 2 family protein [Pseudomonadota bacterium]